ncbi:MAG: ATP-binding protein [Bacteroidota bacterium]
MTRWLAIACFLIPWSIQAQQDQQRPIEDLIQQFSRSNDARRKELDNIIRFAIERTPLEKADSLLAQAISQVNPVSVVNVELHRLRAHAYSYGKMPPDKKMPAEAIAYSRRALEIATKLGNQHYIGQCNLDIGFYYRYLGFYSLSAEYIEIAAKIFEKGNDQSLIGQCFYEAGLTNYHAGYYMESLVYQRKSLRKYFEIDVDSLTGGDQFHIMSGFNTMGVDHIELKNYDSALYYFDLSDSVARSTGNVFWQNLLGGNKGKVYLKLGRVREALPLAKANYRAKLKEQELDGLVEAGLDIAETYLGLNDIDSAFITLRKLNLKAGSLKMQERYWRIVAQGHEKRKEGPFALKALRKALELQDSAQLSEEAANLARLKTIYDLQRKDDSIRNLSQEIKEKQTRLRQQSNVTMVIGASLILAIAFAAIFYNLNRKNKTQLKIISRQKSDIDDKNRQLESQSDQLLKLNLVLQEKNISIEKQKEEIISQNLKLQAALDELKNTQSQLVHIEKMAALGQVTAGIAHEINNPLNFISGGVDALMYPMQELVDMSRRNNGDPPDLLRIDELEKDTLGLISSIKNGVLRSNKIISSLQTFSSPQEAGFGSVSLPGIIDSALTILNSKVKQAEVDVTLDCNENFSVFGDPSQLTQVLINLIDNAIQALQEVKPPRKLRIAVVSFANRVQISVADNGTGIPEELHHKIFEPFFTTKPVGTGTGLGLSISYSIIEKHRGKLSFTSKPGWGTEFKIMIPLDSDSV